MTVRIHALRRACAVSTIAMMIGAAGLATASAQSTTNFIGRSPSDCDIAKALVGVVGPACLGSGDGTRSLELGTVAQPEPPPPPPTPQQPRITAFSIAFEYDSARLRPESHELLDAIARVMTSNEAGSSRFVIEGHTDSRGSDAYNLKLSERRALAVRDYFVSIRGVTPDRLNWIGRGETQPLNPVDPTAQENRRVNILNIGS